MSGDEKGPLVVGLSIPDSKDASQALKDARQDGYDYVTTMLPPHTTGSDSADGMVAEDEPRMDVTALESRWWRTSVVGHIDTIDAKRMQQQLEWANHMNIPAVLLPEIPSETRAKIEYAQCVASLALTASATSGNLWIRTHLNQSSLSHFECLHRQCDGPSNVGMMLCLDSDDLKVTSPMSQPAAQLALLMTLLHKAVGSQLKAICLPTSAFLTNKRGFPALSKTHQIILTQVFRRLGRTIRILVEGASAHALDDDSGGATQCLPYLQYVKHLRTRPEVSQALDTAESALEEPYLDHLQKPLQPLADQLEFQTYETFEKDPVKYQQYQIAIGKALHDGLENMNPTPPSSQKQVVVVVVVGAGRGPLVTAALQAIADLPSIPLFCQFQIYAVEKNPSAVIYLQSQAAYNPMWEGRVKVVQSDMRQLNRQSLDGQQADIFVSELLGSFGDNELSPECLDGLYQNTGLWKEQTVSIPQNYTAYIAPLSSMRLHTEARAQAYFPMFATDGMDGTPMGTLRALETPYVVRTHAACQTHSEQPCWQFQHPPTNVKNKEQVAHLAFSPDPTHGAASGAGYGPVDPAVADLVLQIKARPGPCTIHGLVGTFTAVLYQPKSNEPAIKISTRPEEFSTGMFSWFPLYFPLRDPVMVPSGGTITCSIWRRTDISHGNGRVWYEWCVTVTSSDGEETAVTAIHNPNGRSYDVTL